ncbi:MAG: pyridoxal 5'-phosphate synthase glutaminase subunit PdxT [Myxococcota bacterium]
MLVGILSLQGESAAHREVLRSLGIESRSVRAREDLEGVVGLVLPGGESSTQALLLRELGLLPLLAERVLSGIPVLATCAGLVLLAERVGRRPGLIPVLDIAIERNGFGSQRYSFEAEISGHRSLFIRAPRIRRVGPSVTTLGEFEGEPVVVAQGPIVASSFHPELSKDFWLHRRAFVDSVEIGHREMREHTEYDAWRSS